jgi:hypothetical protein
MIAHRLGLVETDHFYLPLRTLTVLSLRAKRGNLIG